jgi:uncharacterized protein YdhG (YjbR/CyaY superfamily)
MSSKKGTQNSTKTTTSAGEKNEGFSAEERAAMKDRAQELKAATRAEKNRVEGENAVLEKIAEMPEPDRSLGKRLHEIITATAPELTPRLWYGMPAYSKDGKVICFFQGAEKFDTRYATLGFSDSAKLDEGAMWPTAYGLAELTEAEEAKITELVKKAVQ